MKKYTYPTFRITEDTPIEVLNLLKQNISYDPISGIFTRIDSGFIYTTKNEEGYLRPIESRYNNCTYTIVPHRLAYLLMTGEVLHKTFQIDHINHIKDDNRWVNLRKCTPQENARNTISHGEVNFKGVHISIDTKNGAVRYSCVICLNRVRKSIGKFANAEIAAKYYDAAARFYFKEFAYTNFEEVYIVPNSVEELRKSVKKINYIDIKGKKSAINQYDSEGNFIKRWYSISEAQSSTNINNISMACNGKLKKAGGFIWKFAE